MGDLGYPAKMTNNMYEPDLDYRPTLDEPMPFLLVIDLDDWESHAVQMVRPERLSNGAMVGIR